MPKHCQIDRESRRIAIGYCRKYHEYRMWYELERERIIAPGRKVSDTPGGGMPSNPTQTAAERLEQLSQSTRARVVQAIEEARSEIGENILCDKQRDALKSAIWMSCLNSRRYNFDVFAGAIPYERRAFYYAKNDFLASIAESLNV